MKRRLNIKMTTLATLLISTCTTFAADKKTENHPEIPWGTDISKGLVTRLVPLKDSFKSGDPITFRLELRNTGKTPSNYDKQGVAWRDNIEVIGPNGKPHPFFGSIAQSVGGEVPLAPGKSIVLFEKRNLTSDYAITPTETGVYSFRFRGAHMWKTRIPASNTIKVNVTGGKTNPFDTLLIHLSEGLDKRWDITKEFDTKVQAVDQATLMHVPPSQLKAEVVQFDLYHVAKKLDAASAKNLGVSEPFHSGTLGHVYIKGDKKGLKRFPDLKDKLSQILK